MEVCSRSTSRGQASRRRVVKSVRRHLTRLFPETPRAEIVAYDAGLEVASLDLSGAPEAVWHAIVLEADRAGLLEALVLEALERYPENAELRGDLAGLEEAA